MSPAAHGPLFFSAPPAPPTLYLPRQRRRWRPRASSPARDQQPAAPPQQQQRQPAGAAPAGGGRRTRRQTLLLGAAPVCCCAACQRNSFMDRLFAQAQAEGMDAYEEAVAPLKRQLFGELAASVGALQQGEGSAGPAKVLEIGIGSGPNLPYYLGGSSSWSITGIDPNPYMLPYLRRSAERLGWPEERLGWVEGTAEALPLPDQSVHAVVCTLVLCSVPDVEAVLQQVRRVLRPGGSFLFIEHTIAQEGRTFLQLQQRVLDPLQQWLADGCHLTRDPLPAIGGAGFASVEALHLEVEGMGLIAPHVAGVARQV